MEDTVQQLVDVTTTNVDKYIAAEAALVAMMAQQVDIGLKIKASIVYAQSSSLCLALNHQCSVGKKRWCQLTCP
jgi:hypothetical protein